MRSAGYAIVTMAFVAASAAPWSMPASQVPQTPAEPAPPPPLVTVVIDPGHGGDDRGAVGPSGIEEKRLALDVAQRLRALGAERNLRVLLTREDDRQIPGNQRAAFANAAGAAFFISLHANASPSPLTVGVEIASYARAPDAAASAAPTDERGLLVPLAGGGGARRLVAVPWDLAQSRHAEASAAFAQQVGERVQRVGSLGPRAVYQSELRPLAAVNMPAILVDLGYVSNPDEEKITAGDTRQAALAQAMIDAVLAVEAAARRVAR